MSELKYGDRIKLDNGDQMKISGVYALGFHYHTLDSKGNCIKSQQYMLKADFKLEQGVKN